MSILHSSKGLHFFKPRFPSLKNKDDNNSYVWLGMNQMFHIRYVLFFKTTLQIKNYFLNKGEKKYKGVE